MDKKTKSVTAVALFSGGLDSILACRLIMEQSIRVKALKCVSPFFDYDLLKRRQQYCREVKEKYGIDVELVDISDDFIRLLKNPPHGFGRYFNPCIDCKILMLGKAAELMKRYGASFIITGEVLGQRPMSQRRDTLRIIERDSGLSDYLLRPLSAGLLPPTAAERRGLVDSKRLPTVSGRGRRVQIRLAEKFSITDYPTPAGGCILADPNLSRRIRLLYDGFFPTAAEEISIVDIRFLLLGRHFLLSESSWFILGRDQRENEKICALAGDRDLLITMRERPGPTGILRSGCGAGRIPAARERVMRQAAELVVRFGKKEAGRRPAAVVDVRNKTAVIAAFEAEAAMDGRVAELQV